MMDLTLTLPFFFPDYRLFKEVKTYGTEASDQEKVLAKLKADGADGADIRNAVSDHPSRSCWR